MDRLQSILVGVDFTPCSASALKQAMRIAAWNKATLRVVHVLESLVVADMEKALAKMQSDVRSRMIEGAQREWQEFSAGIPGAASLAFSVEVDHPIAGIARLVEKHNVDLLVLGTHGTTPASRGAGSTASGCTRQARTRVLLVEDPHTGPFAKVLACVDFSDASRDALAQAVRVAWQDKSHLHVLHVFDAPWHHLHYRSATASATPDFQKQYTDSLEQQLHLFCEPLKKDMAAIGTTFHVIDLPHHGAAIINFALENKTDLVVLGRRGRANLRDLLIGSTAERVVRDTPCSILTVKPD